MTQTQQHPYSTLTPDLILDAVESQGVHSDYRLYPLNSYENRVYQVGIEDAAPLIAKFYRPTRWNKSQIQAEHDAVLALKAAGVSVAPPLVINGQSLFEHQGFLYSLTEKIPGESPEAGNLDQLFQIGELIGQLHHLSHDWQLAERPYVSELDRVQQAAQWVLHCPQLPKKLHTDYVKVIEELTLAMSKTMQALPHNTLRFIHGDCHRSNLLQRDGNMTLLDFDDCRIGFAIQDLWMHLSDANEKRAQLSELIEGYESYASFDTRELDLIDVFMASRQIIYTAWIAERWHDPAFPSIFPHFAQETYWLQHLNELKELLLNWGKWR